MIYESHKLLNRLLMTIIITDDADDDGFLLQTFSPLVDKHGLSDEDRPVPVEFVGDHER